MATVPMRIGELSERTGLGQRAIHYYESLGLIHPVQREGKGYRYFDEQAVVRIEKIQVLKQLGLSLEEIATVIDAYFEDGTMVKGKRKVLAILKKHLAAVDEKLGDLTKHRAELCANISKIQSILDNISRTHRKE